MPGCKSNAEHGKRPAGRLVALSGLVGAGKTALVRQLQDELEGLRRRLREDYSFHTMVSKSPRMRTNSASASV